MADDTIAAISVALGLDVRDIETQGKAARDKLNEIFPKKLTRELVLKPVFPRVPETEIRRAVSVVRKAVNEEMAQARAISPKFTITKSSAESLRRSINQQLGANGKPVNVPVSLKGPTKGQVTTMLRDIQRDINQAKFQVKIPVYYYAANKPPMPPTGSGGTPGTPSGSGGGGGTGRARPTGPRTSGGAGGAPPPASEPAPSSPPPPTGSTRADRSAANKAAWAQKRAQEQAAREAAKQQATPAEQPAPPPTATAKQPRSLSKVKTPRATTAPTMEPPAAAAPPPPPPPTGPRPTTPNRGGSARRAPSRPPQAEGPAGSAGYTDRRGRMDRRSPYEYDEMDLMAQEAERVNGTRARGPRTRGSNLGAPLTAAERAAAEELKKPANQARMRNERYLARRQAERRGGAEDEAITSGKITVPYGKPDPHTGLRKTKQISIDDAIKLAKKQGRLDTGLGGQLSEKELENLRWKHRSYKKAEAINAELEGIQFDPATGAPLLGGLHSALTASVGPTVAADLATAWGAHLMGRAAESPEAKIALQREASKAAKRASENMTPEMTGRKRIRHSLRNVANAQHGDIDKAASDLILTNALIGTIIGDEGVQNNATARVQNAGRRGRGVGPGTVKGNYRVGAQPIVEYDSEENPSPLRDKQGNVKASPYMKQLARANRFVTGEKELSEKEGPAFVPCTAIYTLNGITYHCTGRLGHDTGEHPTPHHFNVSRTAQRRAQAARAKEANAAQAARQGARAANETFSGTPFRATGPAPEGNAPLGGSGPVPGAELGGRRRVTQKGAPEPEPKADSRPHPPRASGPQPRVDYEQQKAEQEAYEKAQRAFFDSDFFKNFSSRTRGPSGQAHWGGAKEGVVGDDEPLGLKGKLKAMALLGNSPNQQQIALDIMLRRGFTGMFNAEERDKLAAIGLKFPKGLADGGEVKTAKIFSRPFGATASASGLRAATNIASINDYAWKKARAAQIRRQPFCVNCGLGRAESRYLISQGGSHQKYGLKADHIESQAHGGDKYDPSNFQTLCGSCNSAKAHLSMRISNFDKPRKWKKPIEGKADGGRVLRGSLLRGELPNEITNRDSGSRYAIERLLDGPTGLRLVNLRRLGDGPEERMTLEYHELLRKLNTKGGAWHRADGGGLRARLGLDQGVYVVNERGQEAYESKSGRYDQLLGDRERLFAPPEDGKIIPHHKVPEWIRRAQEKQAMYGYVAEKELHREDGGDVKGLKFHGTKGQIISAARAAGQGWVKGFGEIARVFVTNFPGWMTNNQVGQSIQRQAAQPQAQPQARAPQAGPLGQMNFGLGGQGTFTNMAPPIFGNVQPPQAQGVPGAQQQQRQRQRQQQPPGAQPPPPGGPPPGQQNFGFNPPPGGGGPPQGNATFNPRVNALLRQLSVGRAEDIAEPLRARIGGARSQISESMQLTPARAFSVLLGQVAQVGVGGRAGIIKRRDAANQAAAVAVSRTTRFTRTQEAVESARAKFAEARNPLSGATPEQIEDARQNLLIARQARAVASARAQVSTKKAEDLASKVVTKPDALRSAVVGLGGIIGGTIVFSAAMAAVQMGLQVFGKAISTSADQVVGFGMTAARVTDQLKQTIQQQPGHPGAALASYFGGIGLSPQQAAALGPGAAVAQRMGGVENLIAQRDLARSANYYQRTGQMVGINTGFNNGLLPGVPILQNINQTPGFSEVVQDQLKLMGFTGHGGIPYPNARSPLTNTMTPDQIKAMNEQAQAAALPGNTKNAIDYLKSLDANAQKSLQGQMAGLKLAHSDSDAQIKATQQAFDKAGMGDLGNQLQQLGFALSLPNGQSLVDANGNLNAAAPQAALAWANASANGALMPNASNLFLGSIPQLETQRAQNQFAGQYARNVEIPTSLAMSQLAHPFMPVSALTTSNMSASDIASITKYSSAISDIQQKSLQMAQPGYDWLAKLSPEAQAAIAQMHDLGNQITALQTAAQKINLTQQTDEWNRQQYLALRQAGDMVGLLGKQAYQTKVITDFDKQGNAIYSDKVIAATEYGQLQREQIMVSRQQQALDLQIQQRQINFNRAVAGIQVQGATPAEMAARVANAKVLANEQQKQLDLATKQFNIGVKVQNIEIDRQAHDYLDRQLQSIFEGHSVQVNMGPLEQQLQEANNLMGSIKTAGDTFVTEQQAAEKAMGEAVIAAQSQVDTFTSQYKNMVDGDLAYLQTQYAGLFAGITLPGTPLDQNNSHYDSNTGTWVPNAPTYASGSYDVPRDMMAKVHAGEMILPANVAAWMRMGGTTMPNQSGGNVTIVNINNPTVRNDSDIDMIARKVEEVMNRRAAAVGVV